MVPVAPPESPSEERSRFAPEAACLGRLPKMLSGRLASKLLFFQDLRRRRLHRGAGL